MDTSNIGFNSASIAPPSMEPTYRIISGFWRRLLGFIIDGLCLGLTGLVLGLFLFDSFARLAGWG